MDAKLIGYGITSFFLGVFMSMITLPIVNGFMSAMNTGTNAIGDTIEAIIWIGFIILWALTTLVLPAYFINTGLRTEDNIPGFAKIIIGTLTFLFSVLITYQAWFMITAVSDAMTSTTVQAFYWIGLIINWTMITIITPLYLIIDGTQN